MRKIQKLLSLLMAAVMVFSLAACKPEEKTPVDANKPGKATEAPAKTEDGAKEPAGAEEPAIDTSKRADLVFYVMGDAPKDEEAVEEAINKILLEKVNATVDFQFSTWTDWSQKYNLELTSGTADLIYVANWNNYATLANSGAFADLADLLAYAHNISTKMDQSLLDQCRVGGKMYAVPNTWPEFTINGISYREDLRAKYNLPVPNSIENVEAYFEGIKKNEPTQGILAVTTGESTGLQIAFDAATILNIKYPWVTNNALPYGLAANYDTPSTVYDYWNSDDFVEDMKLLKKWADAGYWSRSALSDTNDSEAYNNGICVAVVAGQNPNKNISASNKFIENNHPEWESVFLAYGETTGVIYPAHATQNATAIVNTSPNKERAIMVLDLLLYDKELNDLVEYGIKGTHYDVDADGIYQNLSTDFPYEGFNTWALRNNDYKLPQSTDVVLNEMFAKYNELGAKTKFPNVNIYSGFAEDYTGYEVERSAVSDVMRQYLAPIQAGLVADVDAAVKEFREKVNAAGLETCREQFKAQWAAYCEEYNYK